MFDGGESFLKNINWPQTDTDGHGQFNEYDLTSTKGCHRFARRTVDIEIAEILNGVVW